MVIYLLFTKMIRGGTMIRGTTPKLEFEIPFPTDAIKGIFVSFQQNGKVVIEKAIHECEVKDNQIGCQLTQEDTLKLQSGEAVKIQLRVLTNHDEALASNIISLRVEEILKDGVI